MSCPYCGGDKPRSLPQHRRFFGLIAAVYGQWPELHDFQPDSPEHLRAWLLVKAGYRRSTYIDSAGLDHSALVPVLTAGMRAAGTYAWLVEHHGRLAIVAPRTIRFEALGHKAFCSLERAVEDVIYAETGIDPGRALEERGKAA